MEPSGSQGCVGNIKVLSGLGWCLQNHFHMLFFLLLLPFYNPSAIKPTKWQTNLPTCYFPSQVCLPTPREIETNELLIWQYDLRNIFALSEKFLSYLKEEGKGLVLRMAGYWSQEVLNVRWDYALQEVEVVGGKGGGHQKHLHLHLNKGQYQQQNFISQNRVSGQSNDWFSLAAYKELHLQCLSSCSPTLIMGANYFAGLWKQQTRHTHTHMCVQTFPISQVFLLKSSTAGYEAAYSSPVKFIILRH